MVELVTDVFIGKVVAAPPATPAAEASPGGPVVVGLAGGSRVEFTLEVIESLKGSARGRVQVVTPKDEAACGFPFKVGETYLVFAKQKVGETELFTDLCKGNASGDELPAQAEEVRRVVGRD